MTAQTSATQIVDVRALPAEARAALLKRFDGELFRPAFPDDDIREDPQVWLDLMADDPGPPMPIVTPLIALGPDDSVLGGVVIEYYRTAKAAFLTYIVISPNARRSGLGGKLAAAALDAVTALNGGMAPIVFAEAERVEDAEDAEDRLHNKARLEVLSRMGAVRADFDYIQPALAPGRSPHPLNLLAAKSTLPDGATAPAPLVAAFLAELYRSLGHDPETDTNYRSMAARLAQEPTVRFNPLTASPPVTAAAADETAVTHAYRETPALDGIESFSMAYIFELSIARPRRAGPMQAFRLDAIHRALDPDEPETRKGRSPKEQAEIRAAFEALVEPLESYHDDVTSGPPGRGGRPLVFSAEGPEDVSAARTVRLVRPARWRYAAEGRRVEMHAPAAESERTLTLQFRDTFCAFESGRLFYVISFAPTPGTMLDEYVVLQLQKLGHPSFATEALRGQLRFKWSGGDHTLMELLAARLTAMEASRAPEPNGVRDVIRKWMLEPSEKIAPLDWSRLRGMVIGIEDADLFETVKETEVTADMLAAHGASIPTPGPSTGPGVIASHIPDGMAEPARRALALAGLLQAVPDFPFQGGPEIWDSTRKIHGDGDVYAVFSHPEFVIEISADWREMRDAASCLAHCPYLLLTWLVAAHDEIIVQEMEDQILELIYGWGDTDDRRAEPLKGLSRTLRKIGRQVVPGPSRDLKHSLALRLELFRRLTVNRSRPIFRYEAEMTMLARMAEARGTTERFDRALALLDRYENIVEDVQEVGQMESDRRLNVMLAFVALLSTISVFADLKGSDWWPFPGEPTPYVFEIAAGVIAVALVLLLVTRLRK